MDLSLHLLRYADEGEDMLNRIFTGDESWVHHYKPDSKCASVEWKYPSSPSVKTFKVTPSAGKVMVTVFWDSQRVLLAYFQKRGENVNSASYCKVLLKLGDAIRRKPPGQLASCVLLLHDNARTHTVGATQERIQELQWELLEHPPYSPDLVPSDFHLFGPLKSHVGGRRFKDDEEVETEVMEWLRQQ
jgi:histone-lysine N-methyltransferase SETMAR